MMYAVSPKFAAALSQVSHEVWHHSTTALGLEPHHWMTCTCGWRLDPAPRSSVDRDEVEQQHKQEQR